jgi:hypothetical protein
MLFKRKRIYNFKLQQLPRRHACSAPSSIHSARNRPDYTHWLIVFTSLMTAEKNRRGAAPYKLTAMETGA